MRRTLATAALAGLLVLGSAPDARAGAYSWGPLHSFYDAGDWTARSFDCAGAADDGTELTLDFVRDARRGVGALTVHAPSSIGGVLRRGGTTNGVTARALGGTAPELVWRVEIGRHAFTSDPVPMTTDWQFYALPDGPFHEGEWTGTLDEAIQEFGHGRAMKAGVMTGGCLGSADAQVDSLSRWNVGENFEPSRWVWADDPDDPVSVGAELDITAHVDRTPMWPATGDYDWSPIARAHVDLERRIGERVWRVVDSARTDDKGTIAFTQVVKADARYRLVWRDRDGTMLGLDRIDPDLTG